MGFSNPIQNLAHLGLEHGMSVVDFGAGSGAYVETAATLVGASGRVYAVDIQKDLLERIKSRTHELGHQNVEIIWSDLEVAPGSRLSGAMANAVIISNLMFQTDNPEAVLIEAKRILKPNGKIMIIDWTTKNFGPEKASALGERLGFVIKEKFAAGDEHYGLILINKK